jgi:hypothetical protein
VDEQGENFDVPGIGGLDAFYLDSVVFNWPADILALQAGSATSASSDKSTLSPVIYIPGMEESRIVRYNAQRVLDDLIILSRDGHLEDSRIDKWVRQP